MVMLTSKIGKKADKSVLTKIATVVIGIALIAQMVILILTGL